MSKLARFEGLLYEFEEATVSKRQINKLVAFMKDSHLYNTLFDSYVSRRLEGNIHPERLLNLAYNLEKHEDLRYYSSAVNSRVVDKVVRDERNFDQFYYMYRHDTRSEYHIFPALIEKMGNRLDSSTSALAEKIASHINVDKYLLMLKAVGSIEFSSFRTTLFMDRLPVEEQYMLVSKAFEEASEVAPKLLRFSNKALYDYVTEKVIKEGDKDHLISAIRNSSIDIETIEFNDFLYFVFTKHGHHIPATLGRLYVRAESAGRYEFLLSVCANKNKKDVLRTICESKDKDLIDKFFQRYKHHPEVKHLVPFL